MIQERDNLIIFNTDVVALYPSIKRDMAKKAIQKAIELSYTQWENVNTKELVRAVALTTSRKEIESKQLT